MCVDVGWARLVCGGGHVCTTRTRHDCCSFSLFHLSTVFLFCFVLSKIGENVCDRVWFHVADDEYDMPSRHPTRCIASSVSVLLVCLAYIINWCVNCCHSLLGCGICFVCNWLDVWQMCVLCCRHLVCLSHGILAGSSELCSKRISGQLSLVQWDTIEFNQYVASQNAQRRI